MKHMKPFLLKETLLDVITLPISILLALIGYLE